jgi:hypothetical protein
MLSLTHWFEACQVGILCENGIADIWLGKPHLGHAMNHLKNILVGLGSVMNPFGTYPDYKIPQRGDTHKDLSSIAGDFKNVGNDLRGSTTKASRGEYGKSVNDSAIARQR